MVAPIATAAPTAAAAPAATTPAATEKKAEAPASNIDVLIVGAGPAGLASLLPRGDVSLQW